MKSLGSFNKLESCGISNPKSETCGARGSSFITPSTFVSVSFAEVLVGLVLFWASARASWIVFCCLLMGCSLVKEPAWMESQKPSKASTRPTARAMGTQRQVDKNERLKLKAVETVNKSRTGQIQMGSGAFSGTSKLRYALRAPALLPAAYSCKFNWTTPNPPPATQRLYWDVVQGARARVINLAGAITNFTMRNLTNGQTYYIEIVSVNSSGVESTPCAGSFLWEFKR